MLRRLIIGILIIIGTCPISCSRKPAAKTKTHEETKQDSLVRPQDIGEHKSIHQEEWEYYRNDSGQVKTAD
ncbi:MAG: hypothetical protein DRP96_11200 [Candidatus Neomarinimicrobiota bacterium]|nr:MAG: hypothetical protein DRP96_11200 [Candidatus Neomarinimicrobiota bacterium]